MRTGVGCLVVGVVLATWAAEARAAEVKGKFRVSLHGGAATIRDEIRSNASNRASFRDESGRGITVQDERDDRAEERAASIQDGVTYGARVDYGVIGWKWGELLVEGSYGRFESDVSDLEVSIFSLYLNPDNPEQIAAASNGFKTFPTEVGEISWHHPQIGANLRFRPGKPFVPYLGVGAGRYLVDFKRSREIDVLSANLSASVGTFSKFDEKFRLLSQKTRQLRGIEVEAPDASEWHLTGGIEYAVGTRWFIFLDARYHFTDGHLRITTDGREDFGTSVPDGFVDFRVPDSGTSVVIPPGSGGILDTGSAKRDPENPNRFKVGAPDGMLDPGEIYILGGKIKYGGFIFSTGVRFTF